MYTPNFQASLPLGLQKLGVHDKAQTSPAHLRHGCFEKELYLIEADCGSLGLQHLANA